MKKVLALAVLAVSMSFFACNNNKAGNDENATDSTMTTPAPEQTPTTTPDTMNTGSDSGSMMNQDTTHKM